MRMRFTSSICLLIGAILACAAPVLMSGQSGSSNQQANGVLYSQEQQLANAEKHKDKNYFEQKLDDGLIFVAYDGMVFTKSKILESLNYIDVSRYAIKNMKVRSLGGDGGLVTYDLLLTGKIGGHDLPTKQYASSVWVKHGDDWKLVFHQSTPAHHD